ncbi:MAG: hypothetical protein DRH90_17720 [Deltaproteobacteria bacterium]|nr:MAG: hypothetical protein DRH90_17720 [Deltaproteobacteria bacterium]
MGLKIYYKDSNEQFVEISLYGDLASPVTTVHNGKTGNNVITQLFLRNDAASKWFSNISILPVDTENVNPYGDVSYVETGWGVKLSEGASEPSKGQWEDTDWGDTASMEAIGSDVAADTTTYYPFWYLISSPPNIDATVKTDILIQVSYTENLVA